jgi:hypothetical protein
MPITTASFNEFRQQTMQQSALIIPAAVSLNRIRVGRRRFLVDGGSGTSLAKWVSLELHADGAGTYGFQIPDYTLRSSLQFEPEGLRIQLVDDEWVAVAVLSGLLRLGQHARDLTAASGNAVVRATLLPAMTAESLEMASVRGGFAESSSASSVLPDDLVVAEAVAELDGLASPGAELIKVAAALINEIGQAFGMAEMAQLSRDGAVRPRYFSHLKSQLVAWAEQHQIEVTDDHLPQ